jgi:hypothetical protein
MLHLSPNLLTVLSTLLLLVSSLVSAWDIGNLENRAGCQAYTKDPLDGCPSNTLFVGSQSRFKTVQSGKSPWLRLSISSQVSLKP